METANDTLFNTSLELLNQSVSSVMSLAPKQPHTLSVLEFAPMLMFRQSITRSLAIHQLLKEGFISEAAIVLRSLMYDAHHLIYLNRHPNKRDALVLSLRQQEIQNWEDLAKIADEAKIDSDLALANGLVSGVTYKPSIEGGHANANPFSKISVESGEKRDIGTAIRKTPLGKPYLGLGPKSREGPFIVEWVAPSSPASDAGVERGDTLISLNGQQIKDFNHLATMVSKHKINDPVELKVRREQDVHNYELTLSGMPVEASEAKPE